MTCPTLEAWLEAMDSGGHRPEGAHDDCATCVANQASARELLNVLKDSVPISALADEAFVRRVVAQTQRPRRQRFAFAATALAAAAAVLLIVRHAATPAIEDAPVARGTGSSAADCEVALVTPSGLQFLRDGDHVPEAASLAFRVANRASEPRWLGVFAISAHGQVGWYHPAYEDPAEDPQTLPLPVRDQSQMLAQSVALPLQRGAVRIVCWQATTQSNIRAADALIEAAVAGHEQPHMLNRIDSLGGEQSGVLLWFGSGD